MRTRYVPDHLFSSLQNRRYFFAFFRAAKLSAKRVRSARHVRWWKTQDETTFFLRLPSSRVFCCLCFLRACLRSPEKREKITPALLQAITAFFRESVACLSLRKNYFTLRKITVRLNFGPLCLAPSSSFEIVLFFFFYLRFSLYISMLALRRSIWTGWQATP